MARSLALALFLVASCGDPASEYVPPPPPDQAAIAALVAPATLADLDAATRRVSTSPRDATAWGALAQAYEVASINAEAEQCYSVAAELQPRDAKPRYRAAICASREGELDRALGRIDEVLELEPSYGPAWRRRGTWLLELGRTDEARTAFEKVQELLPGAPDAPVGLAQVALLDDRVDEALTHARTARERAPEDRYIRLILGDALRRAGQADEAAEHLAAGEGSRPSFLDPWSEAVTRERRKDEDAMERASGLEREGKWFSALRIYEDVESRRPDDTNVLLKKGRALIALERIADAAQHFERAAQRFPGDYDLRVGQADALRRTGAVEDAQRALGVIIERWPDRQEAHLLQGRILEDKNQLNAARRSFQAAAAIAKDDLRGQMFEGQLLLKRERFEAAASVLEPPALDPSLRPSLEYFRITLQALVLGRVKTARVNAVFERSIEVHGEVARKRFTKPTGGQIR